MQQGMHSTFELQQVEQELRNNELRYHYLVADERLRQPRSSWLSHLVASLSTLFAPRPVLREERGV